MPIYITIVFYDYLNEMQGELRQGLVQQNKLWECTLVYGINGRLPRALTT